MLVKINDIITDGEISKRVAKGFSGWHSNMNISDIPGEIVKTVPLPAVFKPMDCDISRPVDLSWIPKRKLKGRCPTNRNLR